MEQFLVYKSVRESVFKSECGTVPSERMACVQVRRDGCSGVVPGMWPVIIEVGFFVPSVDVVVFADNDVSAAFKIKAVF